MKTIKVDGIEIPLTPELIKAIKEAEEKPKRWTPKFGDIYWFLDSYGHPYLDSYGHPYLDSYGHPYNDWKGDTTDNYRIKQNNVFKTEKEAIMANHRDRLHRTPSTDVKGKDFWVWDYYERKPSTYADYVRYSYLDRPCFATEEECEAWGKGDGELKGAQEVYEYFYNLKNQ